MAITFPMFYGQGRLNVCGQGVHRIEVLDNERVCYMDYFCTTDVCNQHKHYPCTCPEEDDYEGDVGLPVEAD